MSVTPVTLWWMAKFVYDVNGPKPLYPSSPFSCLSFLCPVHNNRRTSNSFPHSNPDFNEYVSHELHKHTQATAWILHGTCTGRYPCDCSTALSWDKKVWEICSLKNLQPKEFESVHAFQTVRYTTIQKKFPRIQQTGFFLSHTADYLNMFWLNMIGPEM